MSDRIWIWFAENGNIRKWQRGPFEEGTEYVVAAHADAELDEMTRSCLAEREGRIKAEAKLAGGEVTEVKDWKAEADRDALIEEAKDFTERMTSQPWACELIDRLLSALTHPAPTHSDGSGEAADPEECERTAAFWGAEASKAMLQGDGDEAKRCLARSKRHALNAVRIRAIASGGKP